MFSYYPLHDNGLSYYLEDVSAKVKTQETGNGVMSMRIVSEVSQLTSGKLANDNMGTWHVQMYNINI